jgi:hypothetical protein
LRLAEWVREALLAGPKAVKEQEQKPAAVNEQTPYFT